MMSQDHNTGYLEDDCIKIKNFLTTKEMDQQEQGLADVVENMPEDEHAQLPYSDLKNKYLEEGCIKIENFLTTEEVELLKQGLAEIVKNMPEDVLHSYSPYSELQNKEDETNYTGSPEKIFYLFERDAIDSEGNFIMERKKALKYIAYAVHWGNPQCKQISFSKKIKDLFRAFGYKDPVICLSMFNLKNPKTGDVFRHQDSTFQYTEPPSLICLWMPLEDANIENGCLWFLPGSHKSGKIYQRYERNPEKDPFMVMRGDLPDFDQDKYVPMPTKKGDVGLLHGSVLHTGSINNTDEPRAVYILFAIEKASKWSELNEEQPNEKLTFSSVYDN